MARGRDSSMNGPAPQARAIHMTVKSTIDGEESTIDTMGERITMAQSEYWKTHNYVDEETDEAWSFYDENLFIGSAQGLEDSTELKDKLPSLLTSLDNTAYMDTISAPTNPAKLSRSKKVKRSGGKGKANEGAESDTLSTLSDPDTESEDELVVTG